MSAVSENLARVRGEIAEAARRAGRDPSEVALVGVTKTVGHEKITQAVSAGLRDVGENRVQEAKGKIELLAPQFAREGLSVRWHMVGHLQRNKAKAAVALFDLIQSIDSRRIAEAVSRAALAAGKVQEVLVEVNTSGEPTKYGIPPDQAVKFVEDLADLQGLRIMGLMTVGPLTDDPEKARPAFARLRELWDELRGAELPRCEMRYLSMGMSADFRQAVEEGANMVRIGTAIFGPRQE